METYTCHPRQNCGELEASLGYMARHSLKKPNKIHRGEGMWTGEGGLA